MDNTLHNINKNKRNRKKRNKNKRNNNTCKSQLKISKNKSQLLNKRKQENQIRLMIKVNKKK